MSSFLPGNDGEHMPVLGTTCRITILIHFVKTLNLKFLKKTTDLFFCMECHIRLICPRISNTEKLSSKSPAWPDCIDNLFPKYIKVFWRTEWEAKTRMD